jgi:glucose/arabinose dehydrogenase
MWMVISYQSILQQLHKSLRMASRLKLQPNQRTIGPHSTSTVLLVTISLTLLVTANLVQNVPPASSSTSVPSSTSSIQPTTLSTSALTSTTPQPINTVVPLTCAGVSALAFPVKTTQGWRATKVAGGLTQPRGLIFDTAGNLLVVQNGLGISVHKIDSNGCFASSKTLITQRNLNHGLALSQDGKTLFASSATSVFAWSYDSATASISGDLRTILSGMDSKGHVTRTLVVPPKHPNLLIVSHGSNDNFDYGSADMKTGRSCVKVFDTLKVPTNGYDYTTEGYQMGYGLRNEVGLAFDGDGM